MCTTTTTNPKLMIAEHDIVTYKLVFKLKPVRCGFLKLKKKKVYRNYYTNYGTFIYEQNKVYETRLDKFKAYPNKPSARILFKSGEGFYSWKEKGLYANVKCIIPKGARYYCVENLDYPNEFVYISDKIKIIKSI